MEAFRVWATGNLVENRNRGIFAEWLVGQALGVVDPSVPRKEWDVADLRYQERLIEVKSSGRGQAWLQDKPSTLRFDISLQRQPWDAETNTWLDLEEPRRTAATYVFCAHGPYPATNNNVADPSSWQFWVISTKTLDTELGGQKSIGTSRLGTFTDPVSWGDLRHAVDQALEGTEPFAGFNTWAIVPVPDV